MALNALPILWRRDLGFDEAIRPKMLPSYMKEWTNSTSYSASNHFKILYTCSNRQILFVRLNRPFRIIHFQCFYTLI